MSDAPAELIVETPVRFRAGGRWVYAVVVNHKWAEYQTIEPAEFPKWELGRTEFCECVWKGGRLEVRRRVRPRKWN